MASERADVEFRSEEENAAGSWWAGEGMMMMQIEKPKKKQHSSLNQSTFLPVNHGKINKKDA